MPDITPVVRPFVIRGTGAAQILTESLNAAHAAGLTVSTDADLGVVCVSAVDPFWRLDPRASAISVLGACLLAKQPKIAEVDAALAHIFDVSRPEFHEGIEDGVAGVRNISHIDRLYLEGKFLGAQIRELLQRRLGVPVERMADEITGKILAPETE